VSLFTTGLGCRGSANNNAQSMYTDVQPVTAQIQAAAALAGQADRQADIS